jgi:pimeloyl-ACP methyl ester carboxylesterase
MHQLIKGARLSILDNCGHLPQEELPAQTVMEITKFIAAMSQS